LAKRNSANPANKINMTNKTKLQIINRHLKHARKELNIAKESLGCGYNSSVRKWRKDVYEEWQVLIFCLEKGKEIILPTPPQSKQ
jgi:hypothetical protein